MPRTIHAESSWSGGSLPLIKQLGNVCKLRIGVTIAFTALAGIAITPGSSLTTMQIIVLGLAVLISSACAGGFNQYVERDLDARMERTRSRPFVTGEFNPTWMWPVGLTTMLAFSVIAAGWATNMVAALFVFLGAFFYAVVYTVWLKRRTWLNIVIGGLAGSFAILAGATAVDPQITAVPLIFAIVLFLWTPSHFWSLAIVLHKDYAAAGVPMLPVVVGDRRAAEVILANSILMVAISVLPVFYGMGWIYLVGAAAGGLYFLFKNLQLVAEPTPKVARASFFASLVQLTSLLVASILDAQLLG